MSSLVQPEPVDFLHGLSLVLLVGGAEWAGLSSCRIDSTLLVLETVFELSCRQQMM